MVSAPLLSAAEANTLPLKWHPIYNFLTLSFYVMLNTKTDVSSGWVVYALYASFGRIRELLKIASALVASSLVYTLTS